MERRTFMKYSMVTGATLILPETASALDWADAKRYAIKAGELIADEGTKLVKAAIYCSKLNPARFVGGIIYDELKPIIIDPLTEYLEDLFLKGKYISASQLNYVAMSEVRKQSIEHNPYKASIVVLDEDKTSYRIKSNKDIEIELQRNYELNKFSAIHEYLRDEKIRVKTYNSGYSSELGSDFTPDQMLSIESIALGKKRDIHLQEILKRSNNNTFTELVV